MSVTCTVFGHMAGSNHAQTHGLDFTTCDCCGCDLIRSAGAEWTRAPKGFQLVWGEFGRDDDAGSVFARMARIEPTPRRAPRPTRERRARRTLRRPTSRIEPSVAQISSIVRVPT